MSRVLPLNVRIASQLLICFLCIEYTTLYLNDIEQLPYIPFFDSINGILPNKIFKWILHPVFILASLVVLIRPRHNFAAAFAGGIVLLCILSSVPLFRNNLLLASCLLIIIGVGGQNTWLFRIQLSIMYFGAFLNKVVDPDWWNGRFFDTMSTAHQDIVLYQHLEPYFDSLSLATCASVLVIIIELMLAVLFLIKKYTKLSIGLALTFHLSMLLLTFGNFAYQFLYLLSTAFLCLVPFQNQKHLLVVKPKIECSTVGIIVTVFLTFICFFNRFRFVDRVWDFIVG